MTIENLNQETEVLDLETEIPEPSSEETVIEEKAPANDEVAKLLAKKNELLGKLRAEKDDHELSKSKISELQNEVEKLQNIQSEFEEYKKAEYLESVLFNVLKVMPSAQEYIKFELLNRGYKVIYADDDVFYETEKIGKKEFTKQVRKTGYCFVNPQGELVKHKEVEEIRNQFGHFCYAHNLASGAGVGQRDPHSLAKIFCEYKDGVFVGKPKVKEQAVQMAKLFKSQLESAQSNVDYYSRELPALEALMERLPTQQVTEVDELQLGLK